MKREPRAAAQRDDRGQHVGEHPEGRAAFVFVVPARHLARDSHRGRRVAPHRRRLARGRARRRRRVGLSGRLDAESRAAKVADQLARLRLAAAYRTLDLGALVAFTPGAFRKGGTGLDQRCSVSFAKRFRIGVGFIAARTPFHLCKKSSGASFDDIRANCGAGGRARRPAPLDNHCFEITSAPNFSIAARCSRVVAAGATMIRDTPISANFSMSPCFNGWRSLLIVSSSGTVRSAARSCSRRRLIVAATSSSPSAIPYQPSPSFAARLSEGSVLPPNTIGGCGFCAGLGMNLNPSTLIVLP